jgi:hypothetical protein
MGRLGGRNEYGAGCAADGQAQYGSTIKRLTHGGFLLLDNFRGNKHHYGKDYCLFRRPWPSAAGLSAPRRGVASLRPAHRGERRAD